MIQMDVVAEEAKTFWEEVDVDIMFDELSQFLSHLREVIRTNTATDREYIQGKNIIMESEVTVIRNDSIEEVVIDEDILTMTVSESQCSTENFGNGDVPEDILQKDNSRNSKDLESSSDYSQMSSASRNDTVFPCDPSAMLSPLSVCSEDPKSPVPLIYFQHDCSPACLLQRPTHADHLGHNPLRVPMFCKFQRHCAKILSEQEDPECLEEDVIYKAPCGRSLRSMEEVLQFLQQSECLGILHLDNFSFSPHIVPENHAQPHLHSSGPSVLFDRDISRGIEPVPVSLFNELDAVRPKEFRYRKERWPHGCFLSAAPFFSACCDCTDGCIDVQSCACIRLSLKAGADVQKPHSYAHMRLNEPVNAGLFECGPWCGCEKSQCQNRVVQRGLRVRLQVFRTPDRGWGVRCRDDLDKGTFICIYAGVALRRGQNIEQPFPLKSKEEPVSDDEVEVVEEWTLPSAGKETVTEALDPSPPLYVAVIQRSTDQPGQSLEGQKEQTEDKNLQDNQVTVSSPDCSETENEGSEEVIRKKPRLAVKESNGHDASVLKMSNRVDKLKQDSPEEMYYLDASKEGNVARFINHSCNPNLFAQNVFVDTHDPKFPIIAFFTRRAIKAGTELTWNYSYRPGSDPEHEIPCQCGYENCQEILI